MIKTIKPLYSQRSRRQRGFSLIEIMIVVVILAILAAMVAPRILSRPDQAKVTVAQTDIKTISQALELFRLDNGFYPSQDQGLEALVTRPDTQPEPRNWNPEGYLKKIPIDPWGNPYIYIQPGNYGKYDLYSLGANGIDDDDKGVNATIGNWTKE